MKSPAGKFLNFLYHKRRRMLHVEELAFYFSEMEQEVYEEAIGDIFRNLFKYEEIYDTFSDDLTYSEIETEDFAILYEFEISTKSLAGHSIKLIFKEFVKTLKAVSDDFDIRTLTDSISIDGKFKGAFSLPEKITQDFFDYLAKESYIISRRRERRYYGDEDDDAEYPGWDYYNEDPDI